jgi:hypothetical protein
MTADIWIRDYNPPRCFQKKISGRGKHNVSFELRVLSITAEAVNKEWSLKKHSEKLKAQSIH